MSLKKTKTKAKSKKGPEKSLSDNIVTPPTPEITEKILEKKPWLSTEFLYIVLDELKSSTITKQEIPKMLVLVGPMAAGKSTVKKQLDYNDAINLDVDEFKIIAVKYYGQKAKGCFADFKKIIQLLGKIIIDNKYNFILDTT